MHSGIIAASAIHNIALSIAFGGPMFAQKALYPAVVDSLASPEERGKVVQDAWSKFDKVNLVAHIATLATWQIQRHAINVHVRSAGTQRLVALKNVFVAGAVITNIANHLAGDRLKRNFPEGAPIPARDLAPEKAAELDKLRTFFTIMGPLNLVLVGASIVMGPVIAASVIRSRRRGILARLISG